LQYKSYYASVHFSCADEAFYGKTPGINDLLSFEGSSVRESKKSFREALEDYLATCKQAGKSPDKAYKGAFNVRISPDLYKDAFTFAVVNNISLNDFTKTAIPFTLPHKEKVRDELLPATG